MFGKFLLCSPEAYSETGQSSKLESFANIVYEFPRLTIFAKYSILDVEWVLNMSMFSGPGLIDAALC